MGLMYFLHGFFVGIFRLLIEMFDVCYLHGEIAADRKMFITDIDPEDVMDEVERRLDDW